MTNLIKKLDFDATFACLTNQTAQENKVAIMLPVGIDLYEFTTTECGSNLPICHMCGYINDNFVSDQLANLCNQFSQVRVLFFGINFARMGTPIGNIVENDVCLYFTQENRIANIPAQNFVVCNACMLKIFAAILDYLRVIIDANNFLKRLGQLNETYADTATQLAYYAALVFQSLGKVPGGCRVAGNFQREFISRNIRIVAPGLDYICSHCPIIAYGEWNTTPTDKNFSKTKMLPKNHISGSIFVSVNHMWLNLVNLTTKQVETLFGELEYIEPRLKALGVALADEEVDRA